MSVTLIDFCGFSFNGHHSSEMGLVRVSDGSRYEDLVGANFQDKTATVPGLDGTYFFESNYTQKSFTINVAFDSVTEEQLRMIREVFNGKDMGPLIFDECPYKAYVVKLQSPVQLKYICFDKDAGLSARPTRIYKGEGTIQFVAYEPYARSVYKYLDDYSGTYYTNKPEWAKASRMRNNSNEQGTSGQPGYLPPLLDGDISDSFSLQFFVYNAGDVATDFKLYLDYHSMAESNATIPIGLVDSSSASIIASLVLDLSKVRASATRVATLANILLNTKTHLLEGCDSNFEPLGILLNDAIVGGDFFKIPLGYSKIRCSIPMNRIEYGYLYY